MRKALLLVINLVLSVCAKTALDCIQENTEVTLGEYDPTATSFSDAATVASSDYRLGMSVKTITVCEGFFSDKLNTVQPILTIPTEDGSEVKDLLVLKKLGNQNKDGF